MTQVTAYAVPNGTRAEVRQGINAVLAALRDANAGATEPPNPVPHMLWMDTSATPVLKIRNPANSAWLPLDEVIGLSAVGLAVANAANTAAARTALGLGTAAVVNTGAASGNIPVLDANARLPAASLLTGQTWQNMTASRATAVTYTNSTGRMIHTAVTANTGNTPSTFTLNGTMMHTFTMGAALPVPPGATYRFDLASGLFSWWELR
jgi:hypothetical protein